METILDIIAEMRKRAEEVYAGQVGYPECWEDQMDYDEIYDLADRIEAAHKREQEDAIAATVVAAAESASEVYEPHIQSAQVGNAAAMRESAKATMKFIESAIVNGKVSVEALTTLQNIVSKALSAPARNCDRFADELDAQLAFLNEVWLIFVTKDTMLERDKFENWTEEMKSIYAKWLFAITKGVNENA